MFEDEMTEDHLATTAAEYYRVTSEEQHDERMAVAKAYISSLEGMICSLRRRDRDATMALLATPSRS